MQNDPLRELKKHETVFFVCVFLFGVFVGAALLFIVCDVPPIHFD
jgi:hypothetical protein